jgi:RPA family protein
VFHLVVDNPLYVMINGKVRQFVGDKSNMFYPIYVNKCAGQHLEPILSKNMYEPKYGTHDRIEEFTREHCAYMEDVHVSMSGELSETPSFITVGLIDQPYAD